MAAINIYADRDRGCIRFDGSTVGPKFLGTILCEAHPSEADRVIIFRTDRQNSLGENRKIFRRLNISRVKNQAGSRLVADLGFDRTQVIAYINAEASVLISNDSAYRGVWDASSNDPDVTAINPSPSNGDFFWVTVAGTYNGSEYKINDQIRYSSASNTWNRIEDVSVELSDILTSSLNQYDLYVSSSYSGAHTGSALQPYATIDAAISAASDGDTILLDGSFNVTSAVALPGNKSLKFIGTEGCTVGYASYVETNSHVFEQSSTSAGARVYQFENITIKNAGGFGIKINSAGRVLVDRCDFQNNGWNGTGLSTVLAAAGGALGFDSARSELQTFAAGSNVSDGGAILIELATQVEIIANDFKSNNAAVVMKDCGVGGYGFLTRNVASQNLQSGIKLMPTSTHQGCQNIIGSMNSIAYNGESGVMVIGGINNKFSQNDISGNWNAGFVAWSAGNTTLRDCGLYDNNRCDFTSLGALSSSKSSVEIKELYNMDGVPINRSNSSRFIAEILDTQIHYTGLGSATDKIGLLIGSNVGDLINDPKNIIKIDDVGFIGQDYAIDFSEVDVTNLRLSLGDNSYQAVGVKAVKAPSAGNYSELPFSNHIMSVPSVDVVVDTLKMSIALHEGVDGNVINVYGANELQSVISGGKVDIIQKSSDKIQLRGLTYGNVHVNGVAAGNDLSSMNDTLNAAFNMSLIEYKSFLVSEVGVNDGGGSSLPAQANNWYISYGSRATEQIVSAGIITDVEDQQPFYNGDALNKGHEFIWTHSSNGNYMIGVWSGASSETDGAAALGTINWTPGFRFVRSTGRFSGSASAAVDIETRLTVGDNANVVTDGQYNVTDSITVLALRYGQDNHLYLLDITGDSEFVIGRSNTTLTGDSINIFFGGENQPNAQFPVMQERTERWTIVHDFDSSEDSEWANGIETDTVIKSNMDLEPGEKITLNFSYFGRSESFGLGYTGSNSGQNNAYTSISQRLYYTTSELLRAPDGAQAGAVWTWNASASKYHDPNGDGSSVGYWNGNSLNLGLISIRYKTDNSVELWHETNNERIATLATPLDGSAVNVYFGGNEAHPVDRIPVLTKYDMSAAEAGANITGWYYIESPDGNFEYPLFKTVAEAQFVDSVEGGSGTSTTITYADDLSATTWHIPSTNFVNNGVAAPQHGVWGGSNNILWNEQVTGVDANYAPTFTDLTFSVGEGTSVNMQYKPAGDTNTYNITGIPTGYADNGSSIIGTAETITDGIDIVHTLNVTKANDFGSDTGTITFTVTNDTANDVSSNSTSWTKAVDFDGSNDYAKKNSSTDANSPMRKNVNSFAPSSTVASGQTAASGQPWACSAVARRSSSTGPRSIWSQSHGASGPWSEFGYTSSNYFFLRIGTNSNFLKWTSSSAMPLETWMGIYVDYNGGTTGSGSGDINNYYSRFRIRFVDLSSGAVSEPAGSWSHSNYGTNVNIGGNHFVGTKHTTTNEFLGDIAAHALTTLKLGTSLPSDAEIEAMVRDPIKWIEDYKVGNSYRRPNQSSNTSNFQLSGTHECNSTQVWLMGDGTGDSFPYICNQTNSGDGNTKLRMYNMQSHDVHNVTISGLT